MKRLLPWLALLLVASPLHAEEARLVLLHTTDLHGSLVAQDLYTRKPVSRGLEKLATIVRGVRAEGAPTLLVDAGDCIQGGPLATLYALEGWSLPDPMMTAMTRLGYDAMAVGNHEFDFGADVLARARRTAGFPWLAANIHFADGTGAFPASVVKTVGGIKVGIVGVTTPATPRWLAPDRTRGIVFGSPVEAARAEVARLRASEHCDVVIVLAHTGLEKDSTGAERQYDTPDENWGDRLARDVPGIDALILGHTHLVIPQTTVAGTLVAQAGKSGEGIGRIDLTLDRDGPGASWRVASHHARWIAVTDSVASDPEIAALAEPYVAAAESALARPVGQADVAIGSPAGRAEDGPAWQLIQRAQLAATGAQLSLAALPDPSVHFGPGDVTLGDLLRLYPFENELVAVRMSGADLLATLEQSARAFQTYTFEAGRPLEDPAFPGYQMDALEGGSYEIDLTRPPGQRVLHLAFGGHEVSPGDSFTVAVNRYRLSGAGGYEALARVPIVNATGLTVRDALHAYLGKHASLAGSVERNWTLLPDYAGTPERGLIDRLVREGGIPRGEVMRLFPHEPARRGDLAYALARAFGWREKRLSGAFSDVPDSLEPWLDGVMKRKVLGSEKGGQYFNPFLVIPLAMALDWCERAAQAAGFAFDLSPSDPSFRRGLVAGVDLVGGRPGAFAYRDTLTRGQIYGLVSNTRYPTIRVLEITDFHGTILGGGRERRTGRPIGSSVALAAQLKRLTRENPEGTVLVDGGDWYQGTMISNLAFGRPVVEQMNALGEVAAVIGNHEFDWSVDTLESRVHEFRGAALGANMIQRKNGKRPAWVRSDTTVTRRGVRVGILGLCYPLTPTVTLPGNVAHLRFDDDSATAVPIVKRLHHEGATVVVGVGHIPGNPDSLRHPTGDIARLARGVPGVDVWYGGHSHNQVIGEVNGVPTMISGAHGEVIGVCDLVTDPVHHRVIEHRFHLETVYADELPPDSAMAANVERWNHSIGPLAGEVIGTNASAVTRSGSENLIGELVSDAMRAGSGIDIAMTNSGGLRADLPAGPITRGGVYEVMPFENTVVTVKLSGAEVRRVLEEGLRHGRVTQVSGIRYTYDNSATPGSRVQTLTLTDGGTLADTRDYVVAVNNFMADGGDEYDTLKNAREKTDTHVTVRDRIMDYLRQRCAGGAVLDLKGDGRIAKAGR